MQPKAHRPTHALAALLIAIGWLVGCNMEGLSSDLYTSDTDELFSCQPGQIRCTGTTNTEYAVCPASGDLSQAEAVASCGEGTFCVAGAATRERPCIRYRNLCQDGEPVSLDQEVLSFQDIDTLKPTRRTVRLTNCGPGYLRVDSVDVLSPPTFSEGEITVPLVLKPGEFAPLQVVYHPTYEIEEERGELRVTATRLDEPSSRVGAPLGALYIPLEGRAGRQTGQAPIQSRVVDFGDKAINQQLTITNIELVHHDIRDYTVEFVEEVGRSGATEAELSLDWGGAPFELPKGVRRALVARFAPTSSGPVSATYRLFITPWDPNIELPTITLKGQGTQPSDTCNPALTPHLTAWDVESPEGASDDRLGVKPMTQVRLDASHLHVRGGFEVARHHFTLVEAPRGTAATLIGPDGDDSPSRNMMVGMAGRYTVRLALEDTLGHVSCDTHDVTIDVRPESEMHVELVWDTPGASSPDLAADLDLHVVREKRAGDRPPDRWTLDPADCSPANPNQDWGVPRLTDDDCRVRRFDQNGQGPEIIDVMSVDDRYYDIEVHGVTDRGSGPSFATLYLYVDGELRVSLGSPGITTGAAWEAVRIRPALNDLQIIDKLTE